MTAPPSELETSLLQLRLIVGAMIGGLVVFSLAMAFLVQKSGPAMPGGGQPILVVLAVLIFAETSSWTFLRRALIEKERRVLRARPESDPQTALVRPFFTLRIIAAAMVEAPALFAAVGYFLTGIAAVLAVPAVSVFLLLRLQADEAEYRRFVHEVTAG